MDQKSIKMVKDLSPHPLNAALYGDTCDAEFVESLASKGILTPLLITAENVIVSGHRRYYAALRLGMAHVPVVISDITDELEIEEALIEANRQRVKTNEQIGREYTKLKQIEMAKAERERSRKCSIAKTESAILCKPSKDSNKVVQNSALSEARYIAAKQLGISHGTAEKSVKVVAKIEELESAGKIEEAEKLRNTLNNKSVNSAYTQIKREEQKKRNDEIAAKEIIPTKLKYEVIVIDPPWPVKKIERECRENQTEELDYPTLTIDEIKALSIPASENAHIFLWTTNKYLRESFDIMEAWRFVNICTFVWHKPGGFQPYNLPQYNCEFVIYGRIGSPSFIETKKFFTCFSLPRSKHSEKPEGFYETIRRVTSGNRLDMFNRRKIEGFDSWGKETPLEEAI